MKNITSKLVDVFYTHDEFRKRMRAYELAASSEEWKFVKDMFLSVKGEMMDELFSHRFTTLDEKEKDSIQRAYYNINSLLDFLLAPRNWIQKKSKWKKILADQQGKIKSNR